MVKTFKVNDRIIGKIKSNKGWKGKVLKVVKDGSKHRYEVMYDNGKGKLETSRAFTIWGISKGSSAAISLAEEEDDSNSDFSNDEDDNSTGVRSHNDADDEKRFDFFVLIGFFSKLL
jgi:hypothetical protein